MIKFDNDVFYVNTKNLSYVFSVKENGFLKHLYFGKSIPYENDVAKLSNTYLRIWAVSYDDKLSETFDTCEFPCDGVGDFRPSSAQLINDKNEEACAFLFDGYEIKKGIVKPDALPSPRDDENTQTLIVKLKDYYSNATLNLYYAVYYENDVILRRSEIINGGENAIFVKKLLSANIDFRETDFELLYLHGRNANEKHLKRQEVTSSLTVLDSKNGISSHNLSPFYILCDKNANEFTGRSYGMQLMYSGNFIAEILDDGVGNTRANIGLNDYKFNYSLKYKEKLESPWAVITCSLSGFNGVSKNFNDFTGKYVLPLSYSNEKRPVVVNTWDSCVFDVDEEKCIKIIDKAKEIGADLFVIDDGWFGRRDWSEEDGLGDWVENKEKFPNGLEYISNYAKKSGLKFGLWVEPEMVNPKSDLFHSHPEWTLCYHKKPIFISRHQYVLDFSNPAVVEYMTRVMCDLIERLGLDYIKYDMNRQICEYVSLATENGKIAYLHMVGVYKMLDTITKKYPQLLIENCSSGGGRYDLGMCAYSPQTWISDNTNPFERTRIAYYSSMMLPISTASCHTVGKERCPNCDYEFIFDCAKTRPFGVENDLLKATAEELAILKKQIEEYKKVYADVIFYDFYRLQFSNEEVAYNLVSKDKKKAILMVSKLLDNSNPPYKNVKLYGLCEEYVYKCNLGDFYGSTLMNVGIPIVDLSKAGKSVEIIFTAKS